jgi:hypothetical protein
MMHTEILLMAAIFQEYIFVAGVHTNSQLKGAPPGRSLRILRLA